MNSNFNRQFILLDFRLLEDRAFLAFLGSSEFATYLVLRRHIWRGTEPHFMGLDTLYRHDRLLACSLGRNSIAEMTRVEPDNISRHLTSLEKKGIIKRVRTGRQNIYVLGEWIDVHGDGSYRLEWFYLEGQFGISKSDLTASVRSDSAKTSDQTRRSASDQTRRSASDNNKEENREKNVNGMTFLKRMSDLDQPGEKTHYVADFLVAQLKDPKSKRFYRLVAAKLPEDVLRRFLSEIEQDGGAKDPAKVFTSKVKLYALQQAKTQVGREWQ